MFQSSDGMFVCPVPCRSLSPQSMMIQSSSLHGQQQRAGSNDFQPLECRDKDCHGPHDDIRVEAFCRNKAASALPLIAVLPLPSPSSLQIGLRRPESVGTNVRGLLRHTGDSKDDVCVRGRYEARRSARCRQDAEVDSTASVSEMRGTGMMRCARRRRNHLCTSFYMCPAVLLSLACSTKCTSHTTETTMHLMENFCIRRSRY